MSNSGTPAEIYSRLFNHRPFLQGELKHFVKEFEERRRDREVENVFGALEKVTELRDGEVDKVKAQCDSVLAATNANLLVAQSMSNKILGQRGSNEFDQAVESARAAREKEWSSFMSDVQDKCAKIDDVYRQKESELRHRYSSLDRKLEDEA